MYSVRVDAWSLFIKSNILIWILLYKNLFKNATFLLLVYQNYLTWNTCAINISDNIITNIICGYTILIGKYYQQLCFWMDNLAF